MQSGSIFTIQDAASTFSVPSEPQVMINYEQVNHGFDTC